MKNYSNVMLRMLMCVCYLTLSQSAFSQMFPPNKQAYSIQMHVHGLGHHNGSPKPGSMQWHNFYADSLGLNMIWWSDHFQLFDQFNNREFTFNKGTLDTANNIVGLSGSVSNPEMWEKSTNGGLESTTFNDSSVTINFQSPVNSSDYYYYAYNPRGTLGLLAGLNWFLKPLTADPLFSFDVTATGLDSLGTTKVQMILYLNWHKDSIDHRQILIYNFVHNSIAGSTTLIGTDTVLINIPVFNGIKSHVLSHPLNKAQFMNDGMDNTICDYELHVEASQAHFVSGKYENIHVYCNDPTNNDNFDNIKKLANDYSAKYVKQFLGIEYNTGNDVYKHINGFYPDTSITLGAFLDTANSAANPDKFVTHIHAMGGVASYNHPFGVEHAPLNTNQVMDYRTDTIFNRLVANNVFNCDIMEVGYYIRGHTDLDHHLELWDRLTGKGIYLYANGTNDSHGGPWSEVNKMVTWIWSGALQPDSLVANIKKGRMYFGNIYAWTGECYFRIGDAEMGDRTTSTCNNEYFKGAITNLPPNSKVRITQGLIKPADSVVTYLLKDVLIDLTDSTMLDLSKPSFIRITVFDINDVPIVCSNPIVFTNSNNIPCLTAVPDIYNPENENGFKVYPNPATGTVKAEIKISGDENIKMEILNSAGKSVFHVDYGTLHKGKHIFPVDISNLPEAIYFMHFTSDTMDKTLKFSKTK